MSELYEKTGEWMPCACMGAMYGEPYCPCVMSQKGLAKSHAHVKADEEAKKRLEHFFGPNGSFFANQP